MSATRTAILLAGLTGLFLAIGYLLGGEQGMIIALVLAAATNVFAYWNSDKMILRMYGAQEVDAHTAPELYGLVEQLSRRASLPMPKVYIMNEAQPNAFATGRDPNHGAVAVTTGLLHMLNHQELAGVIAHELAHIKNRDTLIMTVSATLAGAISGVANIFMFSNMFGGNREGGGPNPIFAMLIMVLGPLAAMLVQMAISRTREYGADRSGAEICGHPLWLASALQKLQAGAQRIASPVADTHPATAHLFIVNPLHGGAVAGLFRTHPATEDRVRALRELAARTGQSGPWG
ncbi:MAG: zinc metalloprotease HtpX [Rhodospirillales bacterium]|jgi:heat shock protein HtpX|nr:zinc metalloprotease HtpX [Rhodospirillales bacterium]